MKGSTKNISASDFIPLFGSACITETSTSDAIPDSLYTLSPTAREIFNKNSQVGFALVIAQSQWARTCARSMLLQLFNSDSQSVQNNQLCIYHKNQMSYNQKTEPYNWMYIESGQNCPERWLEMLGSLCFSIVVEESCLEGYRSTIEKIKSISAKISAEKGLSIYVLCRNSAKKGKEDSEQFFIQIGEKERIDSTDPQLVQNMIQNGKKILNKGRPYMINRVHPPAALLPYFLNLWQLRYSKSQMMGSDNVDKIWRQAVHNYEQKLIEECVDAYLSRMGKIQQNKKTIPLKMVKATHSMALEFSLKNLQKYHNRKIEQRAEALIDEELAKIMESASQNNFRWGKQFLHCEFTAIQSRIKSKEIKNLQSLKQELLIFRDYFHKKTEQLVSRSLEHYFEKFIILKMSECCEWMMKSDREAAEQKIRQFKNQIQSMELSSKQQRKQLSKKHSQNASTIEALEEKIAYYSNRQSILEENISKLKQQLVDLQVNHDQKINDLQAKFLEEANESRKQFYAISDELSTNRRQLIIIQSEVEKQRLLHDQTKNHYETLLKKQKEREVHLEQKLDSLMMKSHEDLQQVKRESVRQLSESAMIRLTSEKQFHEMTEELKEKSEMCSQLEQKCRNLEYQLELKKQSHEGSSADMEIALKISEQRVIELESRIPRYEKYEEDYKNLQKVIQNLMKLRKDNQKEIALLSQERQFMSQKIATFQAKVTTLKSENNSLKKTIDQQEQLQKKKAVTVDEWVQTDFQNRQQQQLEEALKITHFLEEQYNKVKRQLNKQSKNDMFISY